MRIDQYGIRLSLKDAYEPASGLQETFIDIIVIEIPEILALIEIRVWQVGQATLQLAAHSHDTRAGRHFEIKKIGCIPPGPPEQDLLPTLRANLDDRVILGVLYVEVMLEKEISHTF